MRRRRLNLQTVIFIAIFVFILLSIIFPAASVLVQREQTPVPIEFTIEEDSAISVYHDGSVQSMDLETYLVGVVAAEMPASFELEALKAQAVAARTYTLYKKNHGGCGAHDGADICTDSSHCQAYLTETQMQERWGEDTDTYKQKIKTAVVSTAGEILLYGGEEIQVFYHACSGGQTENCENVYLEALPYLVSVTSDGEEDYSGFYGKVTVSPDEFADAMQRYSPSIEIDPNNIANQIGSISRFPSGRVESMRIGNETFTGREVRKVFSLNSTNFTIKVSGDITFSTLGFGHGVGMSQTGANAMADSGATYIEILKHYYTGVTITDAL